ncbi:hypothetical protein GGR08_000896 [Bartonella fuyuanensis]|uniref:DUF4169 family protein n=1 Tax=Bartonella fuyuanensis TaxID=1460968 RepID=A0A840DU06_9HYPH|nr:DUF4169 family protein [Bartonella fuyuanensis]MBB4076594.1 hypothetical protein [Bartonella fuyuanensis]
MAEPINFRRFQKQKKRAEKALHAEQNRYRFGRTKTERLFEQQKSLKMQKFLDQNRLRNDE